MASVKTAHDNLEGLRFR
jgi:hypothetical protein